MTRNINIACCERVCTLIDKLGTKQNQRAWSYANYNFLTVTCVTDKSDFYGNCGYQVNIMSQFFFLRKSCQDPTESFLKCEKYINLW